MIRKFNHLPDMVPSFKYMYLSPSYFFHKTFWVFFICLCVETSYGQSIKRQAISSLGAISTSAGVTYSQTAGQSFNTSGNEANGINAGFQQPLRYKLTEVKTNKPKSLNVTLYPNPAKNYIQLTSPEQKKEMWISVADISGKLITNLKVRDFLSHTIDCRNMNAGNYFIKLQDEKGYQKTIQFIISK